ncbi:MAG: hypothetical protein JW809_18590 [Pirellulales bacterium]|nr:hypothetical protein [Pirellulales bacterium]
MHAALIALAFAVVSADKPADTPASKPAAIVVCPDALRPALAPWLAHRQRQGYTLRLVSAEGTAEQVRQRIRQEASRGDARFVVLVGDVAADGQSGAAGVPTFLPEAKINVRFGGQKDIAADNPFADLDDDQVPDLAVGRLSADTPEELSRVVAKTLAYERSGGFGPWRRRLNFVIGLGRFGPILDAALDGATRHLLTTAIPDGYDVSVTLANWQSPYCPNPRQFRQTTLDRLNEGAAFWVYVGHGSVLRLDRLNMPGLRDPIFAVADVDRLAARRLPIALFLACNTGAFDRPDDCLAERMLRQPGGPVAVVAGSRVTMPYAMAVLGLEMMDQYFRREPETLGELLLAAKKELARADSTHPTRRMFDSIASLLSPNAARLNEERREHLLLFNLIGDPMLRLARPAAVRIEAPASIEPGGELTVSIDSPVAGRATVELARPRGELGFAPPVRSEFPASDDALAAYEDVYRRANDGRYAAVQRDISTGKSQINLPIPSDARGKCHIRVHVEGPRGFALGSAPIAVGGKPGTDERL